MKITQNLPQTNSLDFVAWLLLAASLCFPAIVLTLQLSRQEEERSLKARGAVYQSALLSHVKRDYPPAYPSLRPQILTTTLQDWALLERSICQVLEERSTDSPQRVASELTTYIQPEFRSISAGIVKAASCS
ncbi:hypothetical protein IQ235_10470 [Oscillatoriales cyanobacterium LEGE 11467]|uniref:Uncharacterized protein n=1 Tax=Zarconia navalis LEGE 11467 TaxID=1828826 RepID=A0A928VVW4_9CYAN|nr:hypothetical protein [Zarconia navalis]MBE9041202.1 hypothetical protein [Zarconia navalis LEGE 11467]